MITVPVSNSALCPLMLFDILIACEGSSGNNGGQNSPPSRAHELVDLCKGRPQSDLAEIARLSGFLLTFDIDKARAEAHRLDAKNRDKEDREYFVSNGATYECCSAVLRMRLEDYRSMREKYFHATAGGGRPRMPNERERENICADWTRLKRESPNAGVRRRLRALHEIHHGWALNALSNILQDFGVLPAWDVLLQNGEDRMEVVQPKGSEQTISAIAADASFLGSSELDKTPNLLRGVRLDASSNREEASGSTIGRRSPAPRTRNARS